MFPYVITDRGLTVYIDGKPHGFPHSHAQFENIRNAIDAGDVDQVRALVDVRGEVARQSFGRVKIMENTILVGEREVTGRLVDRILEMVARGSKAVEGYVKFLDNLMDNPSKTSVDELYLFLEACDLPITPDGCFLAYKKVTEDYKDIRTGTFDNSIGAVPEMDRNEVDDRRENTCSTGLHFCSYAYLSSYGSAVNDRVVVVKVNPADVVSIPSDYNNSKGRAWRYEVVGEIEDYRRTQITPYYTDEYDLDDDDDLDDDYLDDLDDDWDDDLDDDDLEVVISNGPKLSVDEVREICALLRDTEKSYTAIGKLYGVDRRTVSRINYCEIWRSVAGQYTTADNIRLAPKV